jgi:hypothetical protein
VYKANYRGQEVAAKVLNSQMDRRQLAEFQKFVPSSSTPFVVRWSCSAARQEES